ncbi:MAG: helix-hairpin-helix domain-containing protein [Burkholderiales bacterium]|nr:helix-hairpin-helix domain-containing protein [Burkholderiales bacterium]
MFRRFLFALMGFLLTINMAWAATDANTATKEDLDKIKGIGPAIAQKIVDERQKNGPFKSLDDLQKRVAGVGEGSVKKMAAEGLTVGGGSTAQAADDRAAKKPAKKEVQAVADKPATAASEAAVKPQADAKMAKAAKAEAKAAKASEAKAAKAAMADDAASAAGDKKPRKSKKDAAASAAKP